MKEITRKVGGMTCEMCARHVRKALEDLPGVERADVRLGDKEATIRYEETTVSLEQMQEAVKRTGYELF